MWTTKAMLVASRATGAGAARQRYDLRTASPFLDILHTSDPHAAN
jgi:hypothetical protein